MAAGIGSILATQSPEDRANIVGLGMASATLARISSAFVKDVVYAMITDVLVSEKIGKKCASNNCEFSKPRNFRNKNFYFF